MTETNAPPKDGTKTHSLPSGATLHLGRPPFAAAGRLRNALARVAGQRPLSPEEMKAGLAELKANPSAGGLVLQRVLQVLASEEVEAATFACLEQATYEPQGHPGVRIKVNAALFDHALFGDAARQDYYPICLKAGEAAVMPFLGTLFSAYTAYLKTGIGSLVSKSASPPNVS